ncbi:hypothetical protein V6R21_00450 [Limibacter armeniacum]|uniref:hypothetical protein n=1 Tax=Limibacter armeniacum TaxID=466084 RepID=UPI002FE5C31B
MAISKKGLRKIVVDNREFYWKFNEKIFVISEEDKNSLLLVDFGWYDVWLFVNDKENKSPDFEPKSVTPKFVSESITYALTQGWDNGKMEIEFKNGDYKKK